MHVAPAPAAYVGAVLTAVHAFDQARVGSVLDEADASHGLGTTIDEIIFPALRLVGTFWASGTMDVAHEHLLSTAVARWVAATAAVQPGVTREGTILLAAGPQDLHTLALDCLNLLLTSRGVTVCNLGAQTPVASMLVAAGSIHPTAVVLTSQNPTVADEAVHSVKAMAEAGLPVYFAGSSFVLRFFRQNAPGIALDATLREAADMLTARHTTPLPAPSATMTGRRLVSTAVARSAADARPVGVARSVSVARAVVVAREAQAVEAAQSVISTRRAVEVAASTVALAAARARADRAAAARSAAEAVASNVALAAAEVQRQADASATLVREAAARAAIIVAATRPSPGDREAALTASHLAAATHAAALTTARETAATAARVAAAVAVEAAQIARTVAELDATIESEVASAAAQVQTTAAATARQVAADTATRAANVAMAARAAVLAANAHDAASQGRDTSGTSGDASGRKLDEPSLLG